MEMLWDGGAGLYFMEMNTRLQVEHTVTEEVTGLDLVEWQLRVGANQPLELQVDTQGHAMQCRINAEDTDDDFRPVPGVVERLVLPGGEGVRVDTHLGDGDEISPHYDSMIAKIIAHAPTRDQTIEVMKRALDDFSITGVPTTASFHRTLLEHSEFRSGSYDTGLLERLDP